MERTAGLRTIVCLLAVISVAWAACPTAASADGAPSYAQPNAAPSYAHPDNQETIRGRIESIDGTYRISVLDESTRLVDRIGLHQGTVITPLGLTLEPGMSVTITGYNAGAVFEANRIDTPYDDDLAAPAYYTPDAYAYPYYYPYYGPGWWAPGFGAFSFGIGIYGGGFFGGYGRYYGGYRGGYYGGGYRGYRGGGYRSGGYRGGGYRGGSSHGGGRAGASSGSHSGGGHPHR